MKRAERSVPFHRLEFDPAALAGIEECLRSGWLTTGPKTREFEERFAAALGVPAARCVALNSCTAALHLALEAIRVRRGDAVLVPTMTFAATAEVVRYFDAIPVLVDCEPETLNLSIESLERTARDLAEGRPLPGLPEGFRGRLRAIVPVHYGGQPCDLAEVTRIARQHGADVVEDAAHAFPAGWIEPDGARRLVGSGTSDITCFSFYANKTITTGEGGLAVASKTGLADRIRLMSLHGMSRDAWDRYSGGAGWDYELLAPGFKYNMTDLAAALGLAQLARAEELRQARDRIARAYDRAFEPLEEVETLAVRPGILHARHLYVLKLSLDRLTIDRARFVSELKQKGISFSVHWRPLHMHRYYRETYGYRPEDFPIAASLWPRLVSLPLFPSMSEEELKSVVEAVRDVCARFSRPWARATTAAPPIA
jgi:perosamine synthetase